MFMGKINSDQGETEFTLLKLEAVEDIPTGLQGKPLIIKPPKVLTFELSNCKQVSFRTKFFIDEFLERNKDLLKEH